MSRSVFDCKRCRVNTSKLKEYYALKDEIWNSVVDRWRMPKDRHGQAGMLCIRCFESLLGRPLTSSDFLDCEINHTNLHGGSLLLRRRLRSEMPFWDDIEAHRP